MSTQVQFVYMTASSIEEARQIGRTLVEEKLCACVNILPNMTSIYSWKGKIEESSEVVLIAKTTIKNIEALTERVKELHSYDVPCVVGLPAEGGNVDYLNWLIAESKK